MSPAIVSFAALIAVSLAIAAWAAHRGSSRADLYVADGKISAWINGLAIVGDLLSASTLLGTIAIFYVSGADAAAYLAYSLLGVVLATLWIAGPLRRLGKFTLGDALTARLPSAALKVYSGTSTVFISIVYLLAQLVGAGALVSLLFGISFEIGVAVIAVLAALYIVMGGMLAATWVQLVKSVLLIAAVAVLCILALSHGGGLEGIYDRAALVHARGRALFSHGGLGLDPFSTLSLAAGLTLGIMGLPHLLIRCLTVKDEAAAGRSMAIAAIMVAGIFAAMFLVLAPAGVAFVSGVPRFHDGGELHGGPNMVVIHLAAALGGEILFGLVAAVAFATILAVVSGLIIATASAASHDIYAVLSRGRDQQNELVVFRATAVAVAVLAGALAIVFQKENVSVLVTLGLAIAASANFPVLTLALYWRGLTVTGALAGGGVGLAASLGLILLGPTVWQKALGHPSAIFPTDHPALLAAPMAFATAWIVSVKGRRQRPGVAAPSS